MAMQQTSLARLWNLIWVVFFFIFLYVPLVVLVTFSFNDAAFPAPWVGGTLRWYRELFFDGAIWTSFLNSLFVAFSAVLLSSLMGIFVVFWAMRNAYVRRSISHFYINLMLPEIIIAVGLLHLAVMIGLPLGAATLIAAHTVLGLGYVVPLVFERYQELDKRLMEAALDLGASPFYAFGSIILPLLKSTIFAAAVLVFIISFDDFVCAYFCAGSTFQTLPLYILSMLRVGISPEVGALSTVLLVLCSGLVVFYALLLAKKRKGI